jgi:hypothetical protein
MKESINNILNESVLKILRPLIRIMIRNGISSGSFEELVRKVYVDEAFSLGKNNNTKTTISSVSAQTGLSRKEVKRLTKLETSHNAGMEQKYNRAIRVISGWTNEGMFTDSDGKAKDLSLDSADDSFSALVKEFSGDITTKAMLDLLIAADCVRVNANKAQLIKQAYVPGNDSAEIINILGTDTNELITTINHNLTAQESDKRYQRKISTAALHKDAVEEFKALSSKQAQALLEKLDAWVSQNEVSPDDENARYVSLGIYYYEQESSGEIQ